MPSRKVVRTERRVVQHTTTTRTTSGRLHSCSAYLWLISIFLSFFALTFALIGLLTPGWFGKSLINQCSDRCQTPIVLCSLAMILLFLSIIGTFLFARRFIQSFSSTIRICSILFVTFASIFLTSTYLSYIPSYSSKGYSYYLIVTASISAFLSSIILSFWFGLNWHFL